jgi:hypothetical protein
MTTSQIDAGWFVGNNASLFGGVLTHNNGSSPGNQGYRLGPFH